ncbi:ribonuclease Y [Coriobacteriia bacterium Es71-Z0120]|uniref:ribonuclease Y n=1 Tax=Parvivirga hydrogeniphila TaxID=2939460 RepID=UPI002260B536|nr:ribonuclease Y [Parvivirga hydrogeniphila]MCL4079622.1 ribonuclease Y [Parvivirga hydrogeniphila]
MVFVYIIVSLVLGVAIGYLAHRYFVSDAIARSRESAERLLEDAKRQAETAKKEMLLEAKDEIFKMKAQAEEESNERRKELAALENRLMKREEALERRAEALDKREHQLSSMQGQVQKMEKDLQEAIAQERERLEALAGMTTEQARQVLLERIRQDVTHDAAMIIREAETRAREEAERKARNIVSIAIQRVAADHTAESTVSVVHIPSDDLKGRLIGREGRNIRAFEQLTGINLIIDDTPEAVILSSFDPVRREIGRVTLEGLIADGRIHPARIEEMFAKATALVEQQVRDAGEAAALEVGIPNLHADLVRTLGRLKFRTSYGQNVLKHSLEVAYLASVIASELGVDPKIAKRAGLLHDIGKAIDHEIEGPHATIGADLARRLGESPEVVHCIEAHHADVEPATVEAVIVQAADAVSASRPGARRETLESYIKRLEKLEKIAESHKGVEKSYAMQAGREIRVMVKPDEISDAESTVLAREIAKQIEEELQYPGQIKVMVIRESRAVEYAK